MAISQIELINRRKQFHGYLNIVTNYGAEFLITPQDIIDPDKLYIRKLDQAIDYSNIVGYSAGKPPIETTRRTDAAEKIQTDENYFDPLSRTFVDPVDAVYCQDDLQSEQFGEITYATDKAERLALDTLAEEGKLSTNPRLRYIQQMEKTNDSSRKAPYKSEHEKRVDARVEQMKRNKGA